jgi:hypothetical protein
MPGLRQSGDLECEMKPFGLPRTMVAERAGENS